MDGVANPSSGGTDGVVEEEKPKVVVIMGPTGSGKSRLAIDLASHFPVEIINADSMQVYHGLDVLTNKVPLHDQKGVPHHLLGTINPNVEFTSKDFRNAAIPLIDDIVSRNCLPVIVGGTNYYIQALVSPFLLDDLGENMNGSCLTDSHEYKADFQGDNFQNLKDIDPVAANRIHPNDCRKINQYLSLYSRFGVMPSQLFRGKAAENWGRASDSRYNCCFICVDASLPVLDQFVEQRVDCMIESGLLSEVNDIYSLNADYTRGLRQAIGVREFEDYLSVCISDGRNARENDLAGLQASIEMAEPLPKDNASGIVRSSSVDCKMILKESIDKVKLNTRRLVRRQKRRLNRLQTLFGWMVHNVDSTESLIGNSRETWAAEVVLPSVEIIRSFLNENARALDSEQTAVSIEPPLVQRDLWTQFICEGCGNKVLRGAHEWEQHKQGRSHRKRIARLRKARSSHTAE